MKGILIVFLILFFMNRSSAQKSYIDSSLTKKISWHIAFNFPTTKGLIYAFGIERQHSKSRKITYATSAHMSAIFINAFEKSGSKSTQLLINFQPIGMLTGQYKWKFESNISFSYNAVTGKGVLPTKNNGNEVYLNIFEGTRFASKKIPLSVHLGIMPRYILVGDYYWYDNGKKSKWVPGFDVGFTYKLTK